ncbi:ammonia-dependent NAD(+) synthetase [Mycetocola reblochoni]|uniref:NH(3)-dependent NAD(+) synthetase n=2 Tax=Mycetocola reblochoni TaxID=331618 RepID=A0A1R4JCV8_9MICO|nr:ammonia-dependent NAD(+) synthetase [Mycetocola reblochoni]RLP69957.1 ammonia-dependent NAD(+) synthetase [Mycetocola reblochoni]SJN29858.1 NAD synthetase [Mycetocola reblochoni REB411]
MRSAQEVIISELQVQPTIDPAAEVDRRVGFLTDYLAATGARALVLGISGGQDSSLAGRIAQLAVERRRASGAAAEFTAVRLPYRVQHDEDDAQLALDFIRPDRRLVFNIAAAVDGFSEEFRQSTGEALLDFTKGNVKARARMIAQYAVAGQSGALVIGTDHAAEAVTGFFTKFGDGAADVLPLSGLSKRQGRALLEFLDAPARIYEKTPTADLLDDNPGQTDEANLGLSYREIDDYLEGLDVPEDVAEAIEARYRATAHKRALPVTPGDDWWRPRSATGAV